MSKIKEHILKKIMHNPECTFSELWEKDIRDEIESNKFAYHLKKLIDEGLIKKQNNSDVYMLTSQGKKEMTFVDGETGKKKTFPLVTVLMVVVKDNKVLLMKRLKEPFYGYWGIHGGKLDFDKHIFEAAAEELKQETGLKADFELKGISSSKTFNDGEQLYNHQFFILLCKNPRGHVIEKISEGENKWFEIEKINKLKIFPTVPYFLDAALTPGFTFLEIDRFQENHEFTDVKVRRKIEF